MPVVFDRANPANVKPLPETTTAQAVYSEPISLHKVHHNGFECLGTAYTVKQPRETSTAETTGLLYASQTGAIVSDFSQFIALEYAVLEAMAHCRSEY